MYDVSPGYSHAGTGFIAAMVQGVLEGGVAATKFEQDARQ